MNGTTPSIRMRIGAVGLLTALFVGLGMVLPTAASSADAATSAVQTIIDDTNAERVAHGLPALVHNTSIDKVAQAWAQQMSKNSTMSHNPTYSKQIPAGWFVAAENVSRNYTAADVVDAWMASEHHRENILRANVTDIGIGFYTDADGEIWGVQNFAGYKNATAPIAASTPTISGDAHVGATLAAGTAGWMSGVKFSFQWKRGGTVISGATGRTYKVTAVNAGKKITVTVTAKKTGYVTRTAASKATAAVSSAAAASKASANKTAAAKAPASTTKAFTTTPKPKLTGTAKVGKKLTATAGTWKPAATLKYQWYRGHTKISGATAKTYTLTSADAGKKITVRITGTKSGYKAATVVSATSAAVARK